LNKAESEESFHFIDYTLHCQAWNNSLSSNDLMTVQSQLNNTRIASYLNGFTLHQ